MKDRTWHKKHKDAMSHSDRTAEWIARHIGGIPSIIAHAALFAAGFVAVSLGEMDLAAFLLWLTTIVSIEAIFLSLFLQNSSNRHGDLAEHQAQQDFQTNLETLAKLEEIDSEKLDKILSILTNDIMKGRKHKHYVPFS